MNGNSIYFCRFTNKKNMLAFLVAIAVVVIVGSIVAVVLIK